MLLKDLLEKKEYDKEHECLTPGAVYSTDMHENMLTISVELPAEIPLPSSEEEAKELEVDLHYAIERVLKRLWKAKNETK
jgi:hypothetical protein